jgi:folate-binding protein YgfZ
MDVLALPEAFEMLRDGGSVVIERPDRGLVRLTGPQRIWFLQNTVSNDVEGVEPGRWVASCFLTPKGKVLAHFRVGVVADQVWLDVDPPATADLIDWFTRYRFRTKAEIEDLSVGTYTVIGAEAGRIPSGTVASDGDAVLFGDVLGSHAVLDVHAAAPPPWVAALPRAITDVYEAIRIEAGVGRFGADYGPGLLAQEAGLSAILSTIKGCYVGQETVARIHFRGHVNRVLRPLRFEDAGPAEGLVGRELFSDGGKVGAVTSAVDHPALGPLGIGLVRVEVATGATLEVADGGKAVVGSVPAGTKVASERR